MDCLKALSSQYFMSAIIGGSKSIKFIIIRCNECFHVAVKGLGLAVDVVLCHGVPVLADSGFEDRIVWKTAIKGWTSRL
uniref:Uncharacterized protein n=1 Tax=Lepeophtheirus salmonis TaxID=72036 RepID=A0A0K2UB25_LEPSM